MVKTVIRNNLLLAILLLAVPGGQEQVSESPVEPLQSFQMGRSIVEQSIEAYGGSERIEGIRSLTLVMEGQQYWGPELSLSPEPPYLTTPKGYRIMMDRDQGSFYHEFSGKYGGYSNWRYYQFRTGADEAGFFVGSEGFDSGWYQETEATPGDGRNFFGRWFAPYVIIGAAKNISSVKWLGTVTVDGQAADKITFSGNKTLYIDQNTHLIIKSESGTRPDPLKGDALTERYYRGYEARKGLTFATEISHVKSGKIIDEMKVETLIDEPIDQSVFVKPAHYQLRPDTFESGKASIKEIADGVYTVEVGPNAYMGVIEFDDFLAVIWSPFNPTFTKRGIDLLHETIPAKNIRYLGQTHHWWDSSGGLVAGIDAGARIITTMDNRDYFIEMAAANHTSYSYAPTFGADQIEFEFVEGQMTISDGNRDLVIYQNHPEQGVRNTLIYYVPDQKVLFSSHFFEPVAYPEPAVADDGTVWSYHHVIEMGLEIDIVAHHNGGSGSWDDVQESILLREEWDERNPN